MVGSARSLGLFAPDRFANQIGGTLSQLGLGGMDTSFLDPTTWLDPSTWNNVFSMLNLPAFGLDWLDPTVWLAPVLNPMLQLVDPSLGVGMGVDLVPALLGALLGF